MSAYRSEALFTSALRLAAPWAVRDVRLDTARHRIDFDVECKQALLACPACGAASQKVHDRMPRSWRHLDFFQYEAWLHADVPRVGCTACSKTTQIGVPWARDGSGFTLLFEALALTMCRDLPVRQAARDLRVRDMRLWRRIEHYVTEARKKQDMSKVRIVGIDETSLRRVHDYVTVVHNLDAKGLLFCTPGRDHQTVQAFTQDLHAHGGEPTAIAHVCMDMSATYLKGATAYLPDALVSYDRFHVVKLAGEAMDELRTIEWKTEQARVQQELGELTPKQRGSILWGMRRNPSGGTDTQIQATHWLHRANLKTAARAWRLKMALREDFANARSHNQAELASAQLKAWLSLARRSRLEQFKRRATTLREHFDSVARGILDHRSNAFVEAMNGLMQQAKRAARGFRTAANFIAIAYLRPGKLTHLPTSPFLPATAVVNGRHQASDVKSSSTRNDI